jgi:hypothetical protein
MKEKVNKKPHNKSLKNVNKPHLDVTKMLSDS